jgi:hypothetical protein
MTKEELQSYIESSDETEDAFHNKRLRVRVTLPEEEFALAPQSAPRFCRPGDPSVVLIDNADGHGFEVPLAWVSVL